MKKHLSPSYRDLSARINDKGPYTKLGYLSIFANALTNSPPDLPHTLLPVNQLASLLQVWFKDARPQSNPGARGEQMKNQSHHISTVARLACVLEKLRRLAESHTGIPAEESRLVIKRATVTNPEQLSSEVINAINSDALNVVNRDEAVTVPRKPQVNQQRLSGEILSWNRSDHGGRMLMLEW
ncbi:hypothetical protein PCANC_22364 [Puccinia coronata f. sp. avenae]|uniref:Uncharacterized protein n=1 Tax=Puccinia coronata f. sp. avenae TaxID=200324 RepID=A0A2N5U231_9BASI|nr:hypothetical protein PCANC_22364 [Puccinia coronata f. sp. avenae]